MDFQNAWIFLVDIKVRGFDHETFVTDAVVVELNFFNWGNRGSRMILTVEMCQLRFCFILQEIDLLQLLIAQTNEDDTLVCDLEVLDSAMIAGQPLQLTMFIEAFQTAVVFVSAAEINLVFVRFDRGAELLDAVGAERSAVGIIVMYQTGALLIFFDDKQRGMLMQTIFLEIRDRGDDLVIDIESPADVDLMIRNQCQIFFLSCSRTDAASLGFPGQSSSVADIKQLVVLNVRDRGVGGRLGNRRCRLGIQIQQIEAGALHVGDALAVAQNGISSNHS